MNELDAEGAMVLLYQKTYRSLYMVVYGLAMCSRTDVEQENVDFLMEVLHFRMLHSLLVVHQV